MNNTLSTTVGIDTLIQSIQSDLYSRLTALWLDDIDGYGRVYKNIDHDSNVTVPQWFNSDSMDYKDVNYNDKVSGTFMFIDDDSHDSEDGQVFTADVKCVFMVDLKKIFPAVTERADAKAQNDVAEYLFSIAGGRFSVTGIEKGLKNVFNGFDTSKILNTDIQPKHCFSINLKVNYYLTQNCN